MSCYGTPRVVTAISEYHSASGFLRFKFICFPNELLVALRYVKLGILNYRQDLGEQEKKTRELLCPAPALHSKLSPCSKMYLAYIRHKNDVKAPVTNYFIDNIE